MDIHIHYELSAEARKQEFFRAGKAFWNKDTLINISFITHKGEAQRKISETFTPSYS